jgi:uncharacterized protein YjbI with pentapeptide repeats/beta-lactamase regulating signal transducer with metallopeptidase domain
VLEAVIGIALRAALAGIVLSGALALLALAATRALALSATTRHAVWMTVLVATALMPLAGIGVSLARATPAHAANSAVTDTLVPARNAVEPHVVAQAPQPSSARSASPSSARSDSPVMSCWRCYASWAPQVSRTAALVVLGAWALGALAGLLNLGASVVRVRGLRRRSSPLDAALADELPWLTEVGHGREIYVRLSYETETPVAIGFRRPVVLIPTELATADGLAAIEPLVLHEHAHLRRYDDWTNLVQRVVERVFWFNPVVWLVGRRIALEREIASDDAVVEKTGAAKAYASSLWQLAREMRMPEHAVVAPGALLTRKQISVRIEQLLDANRARLHRSPATALGIATAAAFAVLLVATSAPAIELPTLAQPAFAPLATAASPSPHAVVATPRPHVSAAQRDARPLSATRADGVKLSREMVASCVACSLRRSDGRGIDLHGLTISADDFRDADLRGVNLSNARLQGVSFAGADLANADLRGADLTGVELGGAKLDGALLDGASFVGVSLRTVSLRGTALRGVLSNCGGCDLSHLDLHGQDLHGITLQGADLSHSDLRDANLAGVRFSAVDLSNANLAGADLTDARFDACDMSEIDLRGARTAGMRLHRSGLE